MKKSFSELTIWECCELYREYFNNYLTTKKFCEDYGITDWQLQLCKQIRETWFGKRVPTDGEIE